MFAMRQHDATGNVTRDPTSPPRTVEELCHGGGGQNFVTSLDDERCNNSGFIMRLALWELRFDACRARCIWDSKKIWSNFSKRTCILYWRRMNNGTMDFEMFNGTVRMIFRLMIKIVELNDINIACVASF